MTSVSIIASRRVVTPEVVRPAAVVIENGTIAEIVEYGTTRADAVTTDVGDLALLPGLVDTHVHVHEPDSMESEGYASASRAAAAGGITTILDMPNTNDPVTAHVADLEQKAELIEGVSYVDVGFWGALTVAHHDSVGDLLRAGAFGFKCFLPDVSTTGAPHGVALLEQLRDLADLGGLTIFHAEDPLILANAPQATENSFAAYARSQPALAEIVAITRLIEISRATNARVHVVHLSASGALPLIAAAKTDGVPITVETCPHYLYFTADDIPHGATVLKCSPPIRDAANREALWAGLQSGVIDYVVSDHAPWTTEHKAASGGDFRDAGPGISSLQLTLPAVWTAAQERGVDLRDIARWMSQAPADHVGLTQKGRIEVGADADLVAFDPDFRWQVDAQKLHHRVPLSAYHGQSLLGHVQQTWLRGQAVDGVPRGRVLHSRND